MRLSPATSTMLGIITMSFTPTYCAVLPLASVETISLGKPSGSARMPAVAMAVPPPPPSEMTPSMLPSRVQLRENRPARACDIAATRFAAIVPRDERREIEPGERGDFLARDVRRELRRAVGADVDDERAWPRARICSATKPCSSPLVSMVPRRAMVGMRGDLGFPN